MRALTFLAVLVFASSSDAIAQEQPLQPGHQGFCLRPRPSCRVSTITEFQGMLRLGSVGEQREKLVGGSLGITYHFGSRYGVGVLGNFNVHEPGSESFLIKARGRVWVTPSLTVDLSPGLILSGSDWVTLSREMVAPDLQVVRSTFASMPGFTVDAAVGWADWLSLSLRIDVLHYNHVDETTREYGSGVVDRQTLSESGTITDLFLGVRVGSFAGLALNVVVPLFVGTVWVIACSGGGCTS